MYTVLLTDDESTVLDTLSNSVHWHQFGLSTILTASDGLQSLVIMSAQKINLLITDIWMPHMNGFSLLFEVRALYPDTPKKQQSLSLQSNDETTADLITQLSAIFRGFIGVR